MLICTVVRLVLVYMNIFSTYKGFIIYIAIVTHIDVHSFALTNVTVNVVGSKKKAQRE